MTVSRMKSERGWTPGLIDGLLGEPDRLATNPHYSTAPKMRLYDIMRVKMAEETREFKKMAEGRARRQKAAMRARNARGVGIILRARTIPIRYDFPDDLRDALMAGYARRREWADYINYELDGGDREPVPVPPLRDVRQEDIDTWAVNYLRHECTSYDDTLCRTIGRAGAHGPGKPGILRQESDGAHAIIKDRILHEIIRRFPELRLAAEAQLLEYDERPDNSARDWQLAIKHASS